MYIKRSKTSWATLWWELVTVDIRLQMVHRSFHRPAGARSTWPAAAQPSNWWEAELPPTLTCHPFSGPRKGAPISLHSAQYSTRTKVISIQISDSSVGVKDPFQLYIVVGYKILYEKTLVEKTNIMNCLRPLDPVKHTPISSQIPLSTAQWFLICCSDSNFGFSAICTLFARIAGLKGRFSLHSPCLGWRRVQGCS